MCPRNLQISSMYNHECCALAYKDIFMLILFIKVTVESFSNVVYVVSSVVSDLNDAVVTR